MNRIEFLRNLDKYKGEDHSVFLEHYGILGQKWGQRRWQNADGTFNEAGKERYFGTGKFKPVSKEDQKIGGKTGDYHYSWHKGQMFNTEYQNPDGSLTKKGLKALNRAQKHPKWFTTKNVISEDLLHEWEKNMTKDQFKTDSDKEKEEKIKQAETEARINEIKSKIKTTKELSGSKINEQELKDIIKELNDFDKRDFERNHKEEYNKVADIGLDALNKAEDIDDYEKIGDDDSRMWFMWEDQTDGLGELAYLYTKGYSKDYVKQYLDTYNSLPYDEKRKYTDSYSAADFVASEFHRGGDAYIDALYNNSNQKDADTKEMDKFYDDKFERGINNFNNAYDQVLKTTKYPSTYEGTLYVNGKDVPVKNILMQNRNTIDEMARAMINNDKNAWNTARWKFKTQEESDLAENFVDDMRDSGLLQQMYGKDQKIGSTKSKKNSSKTNYDDYALLNQARKNLGLNSKKELTQADWNKINAEIEKLKK